MTVLEIIKSRPGVVLEVVFAGAGCSRSGTVRNVDRYSNTGIFTVVRKDRLITNNMQFSRSSKKVIGIRQPGGVVMYGQFCSRCKAAIPKVWFNCDYCCGKVVKGVLNG